ncbi:MAG: RpiB/LacA/LacB family sugar-phosphate isomerase [Candidatus Malihini olakiniferum]
MTHYDWPTHPEHYSGSILMNSGAAGCVVTGCGNGQGAMLACNYFPGVICGLVINPSDLYLFYQINNGNDVPLPYLKGFG